jgi:hypothetical protein
MFVVTHDQNNKQVHEIMRKGLSLHVGVRTISPEQSAGSATQTLNGTTRDVHAMLGLALVKGYRPVGVLIDSDATVDAVERKVRCASGELRRGDTFLWTFSGHGAQMPSANADRGYNEGMTLYDYVLIDDWINVLLRRFQPGVRIILVADCCNSDDIYELAPSRRRIPREPAAGNYMMHADRGYINKLLDQRVANDHHARFREFYDSTTARFTREGKDLPRRIVADVVTIAACGENEQAADTPKGGELTICIMDALAGRNMPRGKPFHGRYKALEDVLHRLADNGQQPRIQCLGPNSTNHSYPFFQGPPFSL